MLGAVPGIRGAMDAIVGKMRAEMEDGVDFVSEGREKARRRRYVE